jgi:GT2 family glycosyltransferase
MMLSGHVAGIAFARSIAQRAAVSTPELPLLSVIVVAYHSRDEIADCLASIPPTLPGGRVETIVVDNSPGDGAGDLIRERFPQTLYLPAPGNLGFGAANNRGYARSRGDYVLFLNPDTIVNAGAVAHCVARLVADASIGAISPRLVLRDGTMDLACRRSIPTLWDGFCRASGLAAAFPRRALFGGYNLSHRSESGTYDVGAINGAFMLLPRSVVAKIASNGQVFDEQFFMYGDDLDLCIRIRAAGFRVVYDGAVSIVHLKGLSVAKDYARMSRAIFDANRDVYLKHFAHGPVSRGKYRLAFGLWKRVALLRAKVRGHRQVRPV